MEFLPGSIQTGAIITVLVGLWRLFVFIEKRLKVQKEAKSKFKQEILEKERVKAVFEKRVSKLEFENEKLREDFKEHKESVIKTLDEHKQLVSEDLGYVKESIGKIMDYIINHPKN